MVQLEYIAVDHWPPLAWAAFCATGSNTIRVQHGPAVEVTAEFFCEAVWDGRFEDGEFDRTDLVSGSGGRVRSSEVCFVSSGSTIDRLLVHRTDHGAWVSNSLPCLMHCANLRVDPTYRYYYRDFYSIVSGLQSYRRWLRTDGGPVEIVYFDNVRWDGTRATVESKPDRQRNFSTFGRYLDFLNTTMAGVSGNTHDAARARPYRFLCTISSGYDSPTVATLASEVGAKEAMTFGSTHRGVADSGAEIARVLGLTLQEFDVSRWRDEKSPEIPFLAANAMGEEVRFQPLRAMLDGRVLLTGYHGGKMWNAQTTSVSRNIVRGDPSGLGLTEFRLWAGFINCAPPFWAARQIADVVTLSNSAEMQPWNVGGDYTRPICRRIVETAGVDRESFGQRKLMASVFLHNFEHFLTEDSFIDYARWLQQHRSAWLRKGRLPPGGSAAFDRWVYRSADRVEDLLKRSPGIWRLARLVANQPTPVRRYVFPWALERARSRYAEPGQ